MTTLCPVCEQVHEAATVEIEIAARAKAEEQRQIDRRLAALMGGPDLATTGAEFIRRIDPLSEADRERRIREEWNV